MPDGGSGLQPRVKLDFNHFNSRLKSVSLILGILGILGIRLSRYIGLLAHGLKGE